MDDNVKQKTWLGIIFQGPNSNREGGILIRKRALLGIIFQGPNSKAADCLISKQKLAVDHSFKDT
jgi:hypothetical protein